MGRKNVWVVGLCCFMFLGAMGNVYAQEETAKVTMQDDAHKKAALGFLTAVDMQGQLQEGIDTTIAMMLQANPMMAPYKDVLKDFHQKYLGWDAVKDEYVTTVTSLWSIDELKGMEKFFSSDIGKKFVEKQPELFQFSSELGYRVMQEHQAELIKLLEMESQKYAGPDAGMTGGEAGTVGQ